MRDMPHSLLPVNDAPQYISNKHDMHELIRYVLDHLDEWQLIWYGSKVPRERIMWMKFSPLACFCNYSTLFLIFSLIADAIYDFFSDDGSYFFHSFIKSTLLAGKDLLRLDDKQNNNGRW